MSVPVVWKAAIFLLIVSVSWDILVGATVLPREGPTEDDLEAEFQPTREKLRREAKANDAEAHYRLGETFHHRGDLKGAVEEYRAAIQLNPNFADAYRSLGTTLLDRHEWHDAVTALQTATRLELHDAGTYYWLGRALMAQANWSEAAAALQH